MLYVIEKDLKYEELIEKFEKAFLTFRYQVVYCPIEKKLRYYSNIKNRNINSLLNI